MSVMYVWWSFQELLHHPYFGSRDNFFQISSKNRPELNIFILRRFLMYCLICYEGVGFDLSQRYKFYLWFLMCVFLAM